MNIDDFFTGLYRVVTEPALALFSSISLIFGGYYLKKFTLEDDLLSGLYPLFEKAGNISLVTGFTILALFVVIKIVQNR